MKLVSSIKQVIDLTNNEMKIIEKYFTPKSIKKNECWVKEGEYCNHIAFIKSGIVRVFYNDIEGKEISCFFMPANNFISSFTSFLTRMPTKENIQAIENVELLVINRSNLEKLSKELPKIQIWRRIMAENLFIIMERRIALLQHQTAQERYETMIKENGELMLKVPLQYIASFLSVTPQHLSRLRKK